MTTTGNLTVLAAAAGVAAGALFFGALAWTLTRLPRARHRAALLLGSFAVRGAIIAAGALPFVGRWQTAAAYVGGLVAARLILVPVLARSARFRDSAPTRDSAAPPGRET